MGRTVVVGVLAALCTGIAIGAQSTLSSRSGLSIGPIRTGLLTNLVGGVAALLALGFTWLRPSAEEGNLSAPVVVMLVASGLLGVFIIMGVAFALQQTGVTAGLATIILGQLLVSTVVDATGWGGAVPIPFSLRRLLGLLVMAVALYLLLPRAST
jgi:transporter family-2 protein